jgi:hypothetical protein
MSVVKWLAPPAPTGTAEYPIPSACGDGHCLNGPPDVLSTNPDGTLVSLSTYTLCDVCAAKAPDPYDLGLVDVPIAWKPRTGVKGQALPTTIKARRAQKAKRRNKAVVYMATMCEARLRTENDLRRLAFLAANPAS